MIAVRRLFFLFFCAISCSAATSLPPRWMMFTNSPTENVRSDDIHFVNEDLGFATRINSILKTTNGGKTWTTNFTHVGTHFRSIGFLTEQHGYAGNLGKGSYDTSATDT